MSAITAEQVYQQYIEAIPISEQLKLIVLISQHLLTDSEPIKEKSRSLLELEGLGAEIWKGVDAQKYVDELGNEWDTSVQN